MSLQWSFDENNVINGISTNPEERAWAWIIPRPHYCDRGRVSWAQQGWNENVPMPSMYFMRSENAQQEIQAWVNAQTPPTPEAFIQMTRDEKATLSAFMKKAVSSGWTPHPEDRSAWVKTMLDEEDFPRMLVLRQERTHEEVLYVLSSGNLKHIDGNDAFPRVYRHMEVALEEGSLYLEHKMTAQDDFSPDELKKPSYKGLSFGRG